MNDLAGKEAIKIVLSFLFLVLPLIFVIPIILKRHKVLGAALNGAKNLATNAAKATGKLGKKAAMQTTTGQKLKNEWNAIKASNVRKGQEAYLRDGGVLSKFMPKASKEIFNRERDKQRRAKRGSDIKDINEGLTGSVASALGNKHENLGQMLRDIENPANAGRKFHWRNADGSMSKREVADEDIAAMRGMRQQGFIDSNGNIKNDSMLATAAMQKVFSTELAGEENIAGISGMLQGASAEENREYSEQLRTMAAAHKYKNFAGATVNNGQVSQYYAKTGQNEVNPDGSINNARLEGASKVLDSGLRGINKDALDVNHDSSLLEAIKHKYEGYTDAQGNVDAAAAQMRREMVVKIADETSHIDKRAVLDQIAQQMGVSGDEFVSIQRSLKSGGAVALPAAYLTPQAQPANFQNAPPQQQVAPQAPAAPPPAPGVLNIPHAGQQTPSNAPAPVQTLPPPLPRPPQGGYGPRPNNRPPRGPSGPTGPSGRVGP